MLKEFKAFALKGNLLDIAVAFIMGAAFGKVVSSFINDLIMPVIGRISAGVDFKDLKLVIAQADEVAKTPEVAISYGSFITVCIDFFLVALSVFMIVKFMSKLRKKEEAAPAAPPAPTKDQELLTEIRDLLKK